MAISIDKAIDELLHGNNKTLSPESLEKLKYIFETKEGKALFDIWLSEKIQISNDCDIPNIQEVNFEQIYSNIKLKAGINSKSYFRKILVKSLKIAAVILFPILVAVTIFSLNYANRFTEVKSQLASVLNYDAHNVLPIQLEYLSPSGSRLKITLADSTQVCLNGNSKLIISPDFGKKDRKVKLEGEGYFNVTKDSEKKFIVKAGDIDVVAVGTSFYVQAYPDDPEIEAVLISGKVRIEKNNSKDMEPVYMTPNQKYTYSKRASLKQVKENVSTKRYEVWTKGELIFEDESFENLIKRLERFYNVNFIVEDKEIYSYSFTASLDNCSIDQIMEYLHFSSPIDYVIDKKTITIKKIK